MWDYWYKESTSVEKHSLAKFHAHNYRAAQYATTHRNCCSVRPSICSCWGAPYGFSSAAIRHNIMFHDITKRGGCAMGSWGDQLPYWSRGSECHGDNKLASLATRGSNCRSWYSIRPPQLPTLPANSYGFKKKKLVSHFTNFCRTPLVCCQTVAVACSVVSFLHDGRSVSILTSYRVMVIICAAVLSV